MQASAATQHTLLAPLHRQATAHHDRAVRDVGQLLRVSRPQQPSVAPWSLPVAMRHAAHTVSSSSKAATQYPAGAAGPFNPFR